MSGRTVLVVALTGVAAAIGAVLWLASGHVGDLPATRAEVAAAREAAARPAAEPVPPPPPSQPVPTVGLGEIIGAPDPDRRAYCDDGNWPEIDTWVRSVAPARELPDVSGVVYVDEAAWAALSGGARRGIASWASACRFEGGDVAVVGGDSGADLGRYSPSSGLSAPEPEPGP